MRNLQEKAIATSEKFLERRGYEIIDANWEAPDGFGTIDIVAENEDAIVFVDVKAARGTDDFPDEGKSRDKREILAAKWLAENSDRADMTIRFDDMSVMANAGILGNGDVNCRPRLALFSAIPGFSNAS